MGISLGCRNGLTAQEADVTIAPSALCNHVFDERIDLGAVLAVSESRNVEIYIVLERFK